MTPYIAATLQPNSWRARTVRARMGLRRPSERIALECILQALRWWTAGATLQFACPPLQQLLQVHTYAIPFFIAGRDRTRGRRAAG